MRALEKTYELLDIVDENDVVVGTVERTPEWNKTRPTIHRFVHVYVWTDDGRLVVQQRSSKKSSNPLKYDAAVGGLVASGQGYQAEAHREMAEELGITGDLTEICPILDIDPTTGTLRAHARIFELTHNGPYTNWQAEAERLEYFHPTELTATMERFPYLFCLGFINSWAAYCRARGWPMNFPDNLEKIT